MAVGSFPSTEQYLKQWAQTLIDEIKKSAILQMKLNKSNSKYPSFGDPEASPLVAGIRTKFMIFGKQVEAQIIMPKEWYWLEHGRAAGKMPPEEPIVKWIVSRGIRGSIPRKPIKGIKNKTVRKGLKQISVEKQRKQLAFLIRRRIADYGTRETKFYSNVVTDKIITDLKTTLKDRFKKDVVIELIQATK